MTTKYDVKQDVWLMNNNRPELLEVIDIKIKDDDSIHYRFISYNGDKTEYIHRIESDIFKTKEELINSL